MPCSRLAAKRYRLVDAEILAGIVERSEDAGGGALIELPAHVEHADDHVDARRPDDAGDGVIDVAVLSAFSAGSCRRR